ncbi:YjgN family protein [Empedobacter falsenii]
MIPIIILFLLIGLFLWFYNSIISFFQRKKKIEKLAKEKSINNVDDSKVFNEIDENGEELSEYPNYDEEKDLYFKTIPLFKLEPRETYLNAFIEGKYRGESIDDSTSIESFATEIYEARLKLIENESCNCINDAKRICSGIHKDIEGNFEYQFSNKLSINENQLPKDYILENKDGLKYKVKLNNVIIYDFESDRSLHQADDNLVFGTIKGKLIGNLLDFVEKYEEGRLYDIKDKVLSEIPLSNITDKSGENIIVCNEKGRFTAYSGSADYKKVKIEIPPPPSPTPTPTPTPPGRFSYFWQIIGLLLVIGIIFTFLPTLIYLIPFLIIGFILYLLPSKLWGWLYNLICIIYFLILGWVIFSAIDFNHNFEWLRFPKYTIENKEREDKLIPEQKIVKENGRIKDTLIVYEKSWQDYKGTNYSGKYSIRKSDYLKSIAFKHQLYQQFKVNQNYTYNYIIHLLKENDKNRLEGVYKMFDNIRKSRQLNAIEFADMVISFVQDYDYYLILSANCDPRLYEDRFVKTYLENSQGPCYPNQPFGINTPVEFLGNTIGDCDTRTLTIYTILSYYNYDVIVLSSDYYGHSLLGVNLPYNGQNKYVYEGVPYTLFETTVKKSSPGAISNEISNMNHWEISLKSK